MLRISDLKYEPTIDKGFYMFSCRDKLNHGHMLFGNNNNDNGQFTIGNYNDINIISKIEIESYINSIWQNDEETIVKIINKIGFYKI